jgi:hypothetical protein
VTSRSLRQTASIATSLDKTPADLPVVEEREVDEDLVRGGNEAETGVVGMDEMPKDIAWWVVDRGRRRRSLMRRWRIIGGVLEMRMLVWRRMVLHLCPRRPRTYRLLQLVGMTILI